MPLRSGVQLILQVERPDGSFDCLGFVGLPLLHPVFLAMASVDTPKAREDLYDLGRALLGEFRLVAPGLQQVPAPCGGRAPDPACCHANAEQDCQKVLVLVGDNVQPLPSPPFASQWLSGSPTYRVLPVYHDAARGTVGGLLAPAFKHLNVAFWSASISEALPAILGLAGLTPENPRIFISYRQADTAVLAMQLFDALAHEGFDVFLDHFRIPPGVDFQARLTQELGDKAMVLLLESQGILDSEWTTYEINIAKTTGLGIIALHVPNGVDVAGIDAAIRITPAGTAFLADLELTPDALNAVIQRVKDEHARALIRRRQILQDSLEGALLEHGVTVQDITPGGLRFRGKNGKEYLVWLTPRPPEIGDFHSIHGQLHLPSIGVVIGLARLMEPLRIAQTNWLAKLADVRLVDEGHLKQAAASIAAGTL